MLLYSERKSIIDALRICDKKLSAHFISYFCSAQCSRFLSSLLLKINTAHKVCCVRSVLDALPESIVRCTSGQYIAQYIYSSSCIGHTHTVHRVVLLTILMLIYRSLSFFIFYCIWTHTFYSSLLLLLPLLQSLKAIETLPGKNEIFKIICSKML